MLLESLFLSNKLYQLLSVLHASRPSSREHQEASNVLLAVHVRLQQLAG